MDRPDVVLLHGAASRCSTWDRLRSDLAAREVPTHALPLLGHAEEPRRRSYRLVDFRDHVLTQLDALGQERVVLVGHSLGAFTAMLVAQAAPHRVVRLVLEEPPVPARDERDGLPFTRTSFVRMWALSPMVRRRMDPRALRQVLAELTRPDPGWWADLPRITAPTFIVMGGQKSHLDQGRAVSLAEQLPVAQVHTIEAGHRVHTLEPARFSDAVVPFIQRGEPAGQVRDITRWVRGHR